MLLKKNIIANYLGQGWVAIMGLVFMPIYVKYLGMEAVGLIGIFVVMQAWLTLLDMGMTPTLNREMAKFSAGAHSSQSIHDLLRTLELICFFVGFIIIATGWSASSYLANSWLRPDKLTINEVTQAVSIMALVLALRFIEGIYRSSLFGLQQQVLYNIISAVVATLRYGGVIILLVYVSPSVEVFFLWQACVSLLSISVLFSAVHKALPRPVSTPKFNLQAIAKIWKFAGGVMLVTFLAILLTQVDKILLSRLLSLESFGYFTLATSLAGAIYMMVTPITGAFYPRLVELSTNKSHKLLIATYHQGCQLVTILTATPVLILSIFSKEIIFIWSGNIDLAQNVAPILSVFAIGVYLNGLMYMPAQLQLAHGWVGLSIKTNIFAVAFLVPGLFWIIPRYGALGSSWIWVILNLGYVLFAIPFMHQKILTSEKWNWYFFDLFLPTIGPLTIICLARFYNVFNFTSRIADFCFLIAVGILAFVSSIILASQIRTKIHSWIKR